MEGECVVIYKGHPIGYLSSAQFAKKVGVNKNTIRVWIRRNKIESLKIGNEHWIKGDAKYPVRIKKERC